MEQTTTNDPPSPQDPTQELTKRLNEAERIITDTRSVVHEMLRFKGTSAAARWVDALVTVLEMDEHQIKTSPARLFDIIGRYVTTVNVPRSVDGFGNITTPQVVIYQEACYILDRSRPEDSYWQARVCQIIEPSKTVEPEPPRKHGTVREARTRATKACNRHHYCDKADAEAIAAGKEPPLHCDVENCEECFVR